MGKKLNSRSGYGAINAVDSAIRAGHFFKTADKSTKKRAAKELGIGLAGSTALVGGSLYAKKKYTEKKGHAPGARHKWSQDYDPNVARAHKQKKNAKKRKK